MGLFLVFFFAFGVSTVFELGSAQAPVPPFTLYPYPPNSDWYYSVGPNVAATTSPCVVDGNPCFTLAAAGTTITRIAFANNNGVNTESTVAFTFNYKCTSSAALPVLTIRTTQPNPPFLPEGGNVRNGRCPAGDSGRTTLPRGPAFICDGAVRSTGYLSFTATTATCVEFDIKTNNVQVFVDRFIIGYGSERYDPYFAPLDGSKMLLQPKGNISGAVYNVVSLPDMQMNQKWSIYPDHPAFPTGEWNTLTSFVFVHDGKIVKVAISPEMTSSEDWNSNIHVEINGVHMKQQYLVLFESSREFTVEHILDNSRVVVRTPSFSFFFHARDETVIQRAPGAHRWPFLQMGTGAVNLEQLKKDKIDGILGQTAFGPHGRPARDAHRRLQNWPVCNHCFMKGPITDYRIKGDDIFGTETKYSRFSKP